MRYKTSRKILIDKRKFETLKRLNCPKEILVDLIFENKLTLTGDSLIDENLESLLEIKEFDNWGGSRKGSGRLKKNHLENQDNFQDEIQDENQDKNQDANQVGDKDTDKDKDLYSSNQSVVKLNNSTLYLNEKEKENLTKEKESLKNWRGEYSNVHLTAYQYTKLVQTVGKKEVAENLINELSENIACKRDKSPPYDENFPDMHFVILKKYWDFKRLGGGKTKTFSDKQNDFKAQIEALTNKYRIEEERELRSG